MAFRFFRRMKIAPGVWVNLSKSGASMSFGPRGAKLTIGPRGIRRTVGIPGTGLYWTDHKGYGKRKDRTRGAESKAPSVRPEDQLSIGFFKRLVTPPDEVMFVDAMRKFVEGNEAAALQDFRKASDLPDAAFMAAVLSLQARKFDEAEHYTELALRHSDQLGQHFDKYGVQARAMVALTEEVAGIVEADVRGLLVIRAEIHQHQGRPHEAIKDLQQLHQQHPDDAVIRLALAELLVEESGTEDDLQQVAMLASGVENESEIHAALMLYGAKALRMLDLLAAARDMLSAALRRKKDRSDELLWALRYERAIVYEAMGKRERARSEFEKLYAEAPEYEDVAERLGRG